MKRLYPQLWFQDTTICSVKIQILPPLLNKQRHSVLPLFHTGSRDVRISCFNFANQTPTVTVRGAYCVIVGSIFDANQQNKTRLENHFYHRDIITIAKLKTWASCGCTPRLVISPDEDFTMYINRQFPSCLSPLFQSES